MALLQLPNEQVKYALIHAYNARLPPEDHYDKKEQTRFDTLYTHTQYGVLYDQIGVNALLFQKIPITHVIDFPVDISPFKTNTGQITNRKLIDFDDKPIHDDTLQFVLLKHNKSYVPNFTYTAMKKFITFIRLVGLTELTLDDVHLVEMPERLSIEISKIHPIYTGKIEVKTW